MTHRLRIFVLALALPVALSVFLRPAPARGAVRADSSVARDVRSLHRLRVTGARAVRFARTLIGTPYRYGGSTPQGGFDCSGFVSFVYSHLGVALPHSSYGQFTVGRRVPRGSLRPGDLVFFDRVGHVGIYVGHGRFIHAPHSGSRVEIDSMRGGWYGTRYVGARRLVRA